MTEAFLERRRAPRVAVAQGTRVAVPTALTVRLLDISANGVLISSPQRMDVGQRARLQVTLGGEPLNVEVEVRRIAEGTQEVGRQPLPPGRDVRRRPTSTPAAACSISCARTVSRTGVSPVDAVGRRLACRCEDRRLACR